MARYVRRSISQQGSALIVALVFLLAMTLIGVTTMQGTTQQESMAGNMRNYNIAFQAAETALLAGERFLAPPQLMPATTAFNNSNGLITLQNIPNGTDGQYWMGYNWAANSRQLSDGTLGNSGDMVVEQPRYVIEEDSASAAIPPCPMSGVRCFRITARGLGGTADAVAILQSTYAR